ncbi:hypothetical protein H7J86_00610 [Mycobacterium hackensackense]|uniref:hypothetical protein n=1 Tax=Mycobacterium hackensackense TaxID=228909 RepID=UPI002265AABB|nr:hypothetical protein [Mycobacterium hackensackense]MCV7250661.1 hypothetical protein [Mycobacterium hackensackense]
MATALLRDYLEIHPRRNEPTAPLFPRLRLTVPRPTGVKNEDGPSEILHVPGIEPRSVLGADVRKIDLSSSAKHVNYAEIPS